ncbi:MAG TPA: hypothetical protein VHE35_27165 [Kofleriaceae bacterium]|nr:hypothetical protein [Kofleriaceae bacterium]
MPESFDLDLATLIRLCLNDPSTREVVTAALEAGPLPVRDACFLVHDGDEIFAGRLRTDRNKEPGEAGFLVRDKLGRYLGGLSQAMGSDQHAPTMSAEELARSLGVTADHIDDRTKTPKV